MKKNLTEVVFILDRSGSMGGLEKDTIGGFNGVIERQKKEEGEALISTVLFDNESEVIHDRVPLEKMAPLTEKEYYVRGCTALMDAIGDAIRHIKNVHKYAREEDVPEKTLFMITTDGMENASRRYSSQEVKKLIETMQKDHGWEFIFLGANIDAVETGRSLGIHEDHSVNYCHDAVGTSLNFVAMNEAVSSVRSSRPLNNAWKKCVEEDYESRGKASDSQKGNLSGKNRKSKWFR